MNKIRALYLFPVAVLVGGSIIFGLRERLDSNVEKHAMSETISLLGLFGAALETWAQNNGRAPSTSAGLSVLELDNTKPADGWGRPFIYRQDNSRIPSGFKLYSVGPDGIDSDGSGDDVNYRRGM